jgi:hypothetical protein
MLTAVHPVAVRGVILQAGLRPVSGIGVEASEACGFLPVVVTPEESIHVAAGDEVVAAGRVVEKDENHLAATLTLAGEDGAESLASA